MKKTGFTLIETLIALAIFMITITFFYQFSANSANQKVKTIERFNIDKLSISILDLIKNQSYDDLIKNSNLQNLNEIENNYPEIKRIIKEVSGDGIDKNKISVSLKINQKVVVKYDSEYQPPQDLRISNKNSPNILVYKKWKKNEINEINPFESEADEMLKGTLNVSYTYKNQKTVKIIRNFYVFK